MNSLFLSTYAILAFETGTVRQDVEFVHAIASIGDEGEAIGPLDMSPTAGGLPFHLEHDRRGEQTGWGALLNAQTEVVNEGVLASHSWRKATSAGHLVSSQR